MVHQFLRVESFRPGNNPAESWAEWRRSYQLFEVAVKYNKENNESRIAQLLSLISTDS